MPSTSKIRNEYARMRTNAQECANSGGGANCPPPGLCVFCVILRNFCVKVLQYAEKHLCVMGGGLLANDYAMMRNDYACLRMFTHVYACYACYAPIPLQVLTLPP